ncbi:MAG TPA: MraY family glycosyltransferase [Candidatus Limnocylindria bacterium]|nr:MraY family glycosyltransferase [Candidatus Limnocylindria bacterium]
MPTATAFALAALLGLGLAPIGIRVAWAVGFLDHPEARKLHASATALLGGLVVFAAALLSWFAILLVRAGATEPQPVFLIAGAIVALLLGLWDDRYGMHPVFKLSGQALSAAFLLASGAVLDLGWPGPLELVITVVALVALMNAVNFLDNMNGMVAGLAGIALVGFSIGSLARGDEGVAAAQLALAGACAGFLPFNFPRARMFLGDAGSLFLGYSLGASAVLAFQGAPRGWGQIGPLLVLAYPAFDMTFVVINRLRERRRIYEGGRDHSNHRLASVLKCQTRTVLLLWLMGAALCASGLVVQRLDQPAPAVLLSGFWVVVFVWAGIWLSSVPVARSHPAPTL